MVDDEDSDAGTVRPSSVAAPGGSQVQTVYQGMKVDQLGLGDVVIEALCHNCSWKQVRAICLGVLEENGLADTKLDTSTLVKWFRHQSEEIQQRVRNNQADILVQQVWDFERNAMIRRDELITILEKFIPEGDDASPSSLAMLDPKEQKIILEAIAQIRATQESGEKFMGIGSKAGNRYARSTNEKEDLLERVKEVLARPAPSTSSLVDTTFNDDSEYEEAD